MFEKIIGPNCKKSGLSLERLHTLNEFVEAGGLSKAANGNNAKMAQYSHQIKELQKFFGDKPLTKKSGKSIELTDHGKELAKVARIILQMLEDFNGDSGNYSKVARIGASNSILEWWIAPAVSLLNLHKDNVELRLVTKWREALIEELESAQIDFGMMHTDVIPSFLSSIPIARINYLLYVPFPLLDTLVEKFGPDPRHEWLSDLPIAITDAGIYEVLKDELYKRNGIFTPKFFCDSITQARSAVESGHYAAVLPEFREEQKPTNCKTYSLEILSCLSRDISLVWHSNRLETRPWLIDFKTRLEKSLKNKNVGFVSKSAPEISS